MIISREYIPLGILKEINDPAYQIFRNAYVSSMGEERADEILNSLIERNQALCNREMGWCIPDVVATLHDTLELDHNRPLYTETLPYFEIPDQARRSPITEEEKTILFFHENEEYGCFSQWFYSPFTVEGIRYSTAEQYMMAKKALLFKDYDIYNQILDEKDPYKCKKLGKQVHNFKGHRWDECKEEIVYRANLAKFSQNYDIQEILLKTDNATLAEASPYDRIWGIGLSADDPKAMNPDLWKGKNLLGHALMRVRDELALESQMLEVADLGVHAGGDNDPDYYYVTPYQKREMDKLLKMLTGARHWKDGDILIHTSLDDEILKANGYQ